MEWAKDWTIGNDRYARAKRCSAEIPYETYLEREELNVLLDILVTPIPTNQPLDIEYSIVRVIGQLVLGGVSDQTFTLLGKRHIRWCDAISLVICNDFHSAILEYADTESETMEVNELIFKFLVREWYIDTTRYSESRTLSVPDKSWSAPNECDPPSPGHCIGAEQSLYDTSGSHLWLYTCYICLVRYIWVV